MFINNLLYCIGKTTDEIIQNYTGTLPLLTTLTHHSVPILDIQPNPFDKPELIAVLRGNPTEPTTGTQIEMIDVRTMAISFSWPVVGLGQAQLCSMHHITSTRL